MKNVFVLIGLCVVLGACSGNPPAWWNPGNRYGTTQTAASKAAAPKSTAPVVKEETLDVIDESYEEIAITPMPDEDEENDTGVAASQNEELLPDGQLPQPSVLD